MRYIDKAIEAMDATEEEPSFVHRENRRRVAEVYALMAIAEELRDLRIELGEAAARSGFVGGGEI